MALQFLYTFFILMVASVITRSAFKEPEKDNDSQWWVVNLATSIFFGSFAGAVVSAICAVWGL